MEMEKLKAASETIKMPEEVKQRIMSSCKIQMLTKQKESWMSTKKNHICVRKSVVTFAVLVICLSLAVTAVAAPDIMKGYFRNITNWQGAVTGISYEQATDEIDVQVSVNGNELTVMAVFADQQMIPYVYSEKLGIAEYRIKTANGKTVKKGAAEAAEIRDGGAAIKISLDELSGGSYKLCITAFVAEEKAEQPLGIHGYWECGFTK